VHLLKPADAEPTPLHFSVDTKHEKEHAVKCSEMKEKKVDRMFIKHYYIYAFNYTGLPCYQHDKMT
jgi:hypothetical protein